MTHSLNLVALLFVDDEKRSGPSTVALANQTRTIQVLNLPHSVVPELATRGVVGTQDHDKITGERHVRAHKKKISGSITLMPKGIEGDIVSGLPLSVLKAPDVERAIHAWPPRVASKISSAPERDIAAEEAKKKAEEKAEESASRAFSAQLKDAKRQRIAGADIPLPKREPEKTEKPSSKE